MTRSRGPISRTSCSTPSMGWWHEPIPRENHEKRSSKPTRTSEFANWFLDAVERHGLVEGATPKKSGRFVVRLPRSLHAVLEREAASEGVSLNQLVLAKLAVGLGRLTNLAHDVTPTQH